MTSRTTNQKHYWDGIAQGYSERYGLLSPQAQRKIRRKVRLLITGARIKPPSDVLEIGCGTGIFTRELAKTGASITAIDISPNMLTAAIESRMSKNAVYHLGDAHDLMYHDKRFSAVVGCYILQYLDLSKAIPEIKRVLEPGGRVAFIEINTLNPIAFAKTKLPFVKKWLNISREAESFTPWELRNWFDRLGFTDIEVRVFEFGKLNNILENLPIVRLFGGSLLLTANIFKKTC